MITSGRNGKLSGQFKIALLTYSTHIYIIVNSHQLLESVWTLGARVTRNNRQSLLRLSILRRECYHPKWTLTNLFLATPNENKFPLRIELRNELEQWLKTWCPKKCLQSHQWATIDIILSLTFIYISINAINVEKF